MKKTRQYRSVLMGCKRINAQIPKVGITIALVVSAKMEYPLICPQRWIALTPTNNPRNRALYFLIM